MPDFKSGNAFGGRLRRYRTVIALASQAAGSTIALGTIPAGEVFAFGMLTSTVTLATATVAVGVTGTTDKYRTAATFTTPDAPTAFGNAAAVGDDATAATTDAILTTGVAALPASGTLVADLYFTNA